MSGFPPSRTVFIGNLPFDASEQQLVDTFSQAGPVKSLRLVMERDSGRPKGFAFCEFYDVDAAGCAVRNLTGADFCGRPLRVDFAEDMDPVRGKGRYAAPGSKPVGRDAAAAAGAQASLALGAGLPPPGGAADRITSTLGGMSRQQLYDVMSQMKQLVQASPGQARQLLAANPQLARALFQAQVLLGMARVPELPAALLLQQQQQQQMAAAGGLPPPPPPPGLVGATAAQQASQLMQMQMAAGAAAAATSGLAAYPQAMAAAAAAAAGGYPGAAGLPSMMPVGGMMLGGLPAAGAMMGVTPAVVAAQQQQLLQAQAQQQFAMGGGYATAAGAGGAAPAVAAAQPVAAAAAAPAVQLDPNQQKALLQRVMSLTPEQIELLPDPAQKAQVIALQQQLRAQGLMP